jgi:hypothetical protein
MATAATTFTTVINEGANAVYTATLQDENAAAIGSGDIDSLTLTLVNKADGSTINSRLDQNVLNANNVTVSAGGALVFTLQPADTAINDVDLSTETHVATFKMQFNTVSFSNWDVEFTIRNMAQVT